MQMKERPPLVTVQKLLAEYPDHFVYAMAVANKWGKRYPYLVMEFRSVAECKKESGDFIRYLSFGAHASGADIAEWIG